jgi:hypothetical protein
MRIPHCIQCLAIARDKELQFAQTINLCHFTFDYEIIITDPKTKSVELRMLNKETGGIAMNFPGYVDDIGWILSYQMCQFNSNYLEMVKIMNQHKLEIKNLKEQFIKELEKS